MGRRQHPPVFPSPGSVFAVPLSDGRYSACRVIRHSTAEEQEQFGKPACLVACCDWIGSAIPTEVSDELRPILQLTHGRWTGQLGLQWVTRRPPDDFIELGYLAPDDGDLELTGASGSWRAFRIQPLKQERRKA